MQRALTALVLLGASASAFKPQAKQVTLQQAGKKLAGNVGAAFLAASTLVPAAFAGDSLVLDTPLEDKLENFGRASYSVFNSITDVAPLGDKLIEFVDAKVKKEDSAEVVARAVDGLLAIPDVKVAEYAGILKQVVYKGVNKDTCVTLGGTEAFRSALQNSAAVKAVDAGKMSQLATKFAPANRNVPVGKTGICLPASAEASEKLWVAQAELTFSMPKAEAQALDAAVKKAGRQATRSVIGTLIPAAEGVFSSSAEAKAMVKAGKDVEPTVIATVQAALK
jgi:hypothetical protein